MVHRFGKFALGAALAAALAASPAAARSVGSWEVVRTGPDACMMSAMFGSGESSITIAFLWHAGEHRLEALAAGRNLQDLREGEGDTAPFELNFDGEVPYKQWVSEQAPFTQLRGGLDGIVGDWGSAHSADLAKALTASHNVRLKIGQTDLGSFDISGADAAYRELLRCGERA